MHTCSSLYARLFLTFAPLLSPRCNVLHYSSPLLYRWCRSSKGLRVTVWRFVRFALTAQLSRGQSRCVGSGCVELHGIDWSSKNKCFIGYWIERPAILWLCFLFKFNPIRHARSCSTGERCWKIKRSVPCLLRNGTGTWFVPCSAFPTSTLDPSTLHSVPPRYHGDMKNMRNKCFDTMLIHLI